MKRSLTIVIFSIVGLLGFAQQDAQFSMNMFNRLAVNPGYAGTNQALCATLMVRNQWASFDGAPKTGLLCVDFGPILHGGVGVTVDQDQLGFEKTLKAKAAYSYQMHLGVSGVLGIGLDVGMINKSLSPTGPDGFKAPDGTSTNGGGGTDDAIPWNGISATTYDLGLGAYYTSDKIYVGISSLHIPEQKLKKKEGTAGDPTFADFQYEVARHYYIMAGYKFQLNNQFDLTPSVLAKSDVATTQMDFNVLLRWNKMVFLGVSYRGVTNHSKDAIPAMVGVEWKGFKLGYAYDVTISSLKTYSGSTHELMLGYCYKLVKPDHKQGHMNVRFL
jgi:type IX secretion system PorP/SprF family membrane protein